MMMELLSRVIGMKQMMIGPTILVQFFGMLLLLLFWMIVPCEEEDVVTAVAD
jgi:hypothetical protein